MRRLIPVSFALVLLALGQTGARAAFSHTSVGRAPQDFVLDSLEGVPLRLSETLGSRATIVLFWASWNSRSREALRDLQQLHARFAAEGLQVISVNVDGEEGGEARRSAVAAAVRDLGLGYPVLVDEDLSVYGSYGVIAVPSLVLIGAGGTVAEVLGGYASSGRATFHNKVFASLGVVVPAPGGKSAAGAEYVPHGAAARYLAMGRLSQEKGRTRDAIRYFTRAVAEDPFYGAACQSLAAALQRVGRLEEADRVLAQADSLPLR
jgi:thioredoxin-like negative regulator of GroEL